MNSCLKGFLGCTVMSVAAFSLIGCVKEKAAPADSTCNQCSTGGAACKLNITVQGGKAVVQSQANPSLQGDFCVPWGTDIQWTTNDVKADRFAVHFPTGTGHPFTPDTNNHFTQLAGIFAGSRANRKCQMRECPYSYTVVWYGKDGTVSILDPRIIVGNGSGAKPK